MSNQKEIQNRYQEVLKECYQLYLRGRRCRFENNAERRYDCSYCPDQKNSQFCKANLMLKKLIRLLAESMIADGSLTEPDFIEESRKKRAPITDEQIRDFKALNLEVALSSPKSQETIWLVPERTGNHSFELTPEDIRIMEAATSTFGANLIEIKPQNNPQQG